MRMQRCSTTSQKIHYTVELAETWKYNICPQKSKFKYLQTRHGKAKSGKIRRNQPGYHSVVKWVIGKSVSREGTADALKVIECIPPHPADG